MSPAGHIARTSLLAAAVAAALVSCGRPETPESPSAAADTAAGDTTETAAAYEPRPEGTLTFTRDVAPIVFEHCSACHRPGESAPFSLLDYGDVRKHAGQIAAVVESRFMPPWLPEPGFGRFVGERRLSVEEIGLIRQWAGEGAVEGDPADLPAAPTWTEGWQLGEPDLVVAMDEPYVLPAAGADVFRNFVIPVPLDRTRYVRAVELRPGNKSIVHHAIVMVDPTRQARRLDEQDELPGYAGMDAVHGQAPDGHFLGWTPGKLPDPEDGLPWRLDPGTDLVLQLHMLPGGKPEPIRPEVGLHFGPPPRGDERTFTLYMKADEDLDIPPGDRDFEVTSRFVLPVETRVERVYPHAHYLGKAVEAFATLPDGRTEWIIRIDDWDFNWQDSYRLVEPLALPPGTTLTMRWRYDNSADNVRNPHHPPRRVRRGNRTTDEMAHLYLQLRVRDEAARLALVIADAQDRLRQAPGSWAIHTELAGALQSAGRLEDAMAHCRQALRLKPDHAPAHYCLGLCLELAGRLDESARAYGQAVSLEPDDALMRTTYAETLVKLGAVDEAETQVREALERDGRISDAHVVLGTIRRLQGRLEEAMAHYARAAEIRPDDVMAHTYMGVVRTQQGRFDEALVHLDRALEISPDNPVLLSSIGRVLLAAGRRDEAIETLRRALEIRPDDAEARRHLDMALRERGG